MGNLDFTHVRYHSQKKLSECETHRNSAWSGLTYQKPFAPVSTDANPFANMDLNLVQDQWSMYRQPGDSNVNDSRQSFAILAACEQAKLYRIIHECIHVYCGARGKVSADALLDLFQRYIAWKDGLTPELRRVKGEPLPHVLFLQ